MTDNGFDQARQKRIHEIQKKVDRHQKLTTGEALFLAEDFYRLVQGLARDNTVLAERISKLESQNFRTTANNLVLTKLLEEKGLATEEKMIALWEEHVTKPYKAMQERVNKAMEGTQTASDELEKAQKDMPGEKLVEVEVAVDESPVPPLEPILSSTSETQLKD